MLRFAVPVCMGAIGGACRDPEREERQERGDEIGPRMDRLGEEPEAVRRDAGDELDGDQHRGGDDRAERRSPLRSHARKHP